MKTQNQFQLFKERRFLPYFLVQFFGALNDNIFKNALLALVAFGAFNQDTRELLTNLGALLFILPFFLFSALAGQLADKYRKADIIRYIKFAEIPIMVSAAIGFWANQTTSLFIILFFMGAQSAFFAPVKYSILPEYLEKDELVGGNGLVETGTFVAILVGTILGIALIRIYPTTLFINTAIVTVAIIGFIAALAVPKQKTVANPDLKINWEPISQTWYVLKKAASQRTVFLTILGISWFWFFGSIIVTQLYNYNQDILHGNEAVMILMISILSVGIGLGSLSCEKLSRHKIEIGLVPFGSIGLTLITIDLSFAHGLYPENIINASTFLSHWQGWHILIDLFFFGIFGGLYSVPLYVLLQSRTEEKERSQMVAANSVLNALFMVVASLFAIGLLSLGLTIPQLFLVVGFCNLAVTMYLYKLLPEFLMRFIAWLLINCVYRVDVTGLEHIPEEGPAIITCNHVSLVDPIVVMSCCHRPIRFVMDHQIFKIPILKFVFQTAGCIPVASEKENPEIKERAFVLVKEALDRGELIGLFPEGGLTSNGSIQQFRKGLERILGNNPVPVVPMAVQGLWGSFFSRRYGKAMLHWPRQFLFSKIGLKVTKPIPPEQFNLEELKNITQKLRGDWE